MLKITIIVAILAALLILPLRIGVSSGGFFRDGVIEGLQSCSQDSDCTWVSTSCCECFEGGSEMLINKQKEWMFNALVKDVCLGEQVCNTENYCHNEEVYCDRTCKFGTKTYSKPLLVQ